MAAANAWALAAAKFQRKFDGIYDVTGGVGAFGDIFLTSNGRDAP